MTALTETWYDSSIHCIYYINGYKLFFSFIKRNQNDGIFVFIKHTFNVEIYEYEFVITKTLFKESQYSK